MASTCTSNSDDSVITITQPTSGSETEEETFYVKTIFIEVINCNYNNNQYAELACFAEENEEEDCEWDCTQAIIPKPIILATNRAQAWKQLTTTKNLLDGKHNDLLTDTVKLTKVIHCAVFDSGATGNFVVEGAPVHSVLCE